MSKRPLLVIPLRPIAAPTCGECTLCCRVFAVPELDKPQDIWCPHARKKRGCAIYADRPTICREFECLWLTLDGRPTLRPDKVHGVLRPTTDGRQIQLHEDPGYRGHARQALREILHGFIADGQHYVVIICGTERVFLGNPALFADRTGATPH